MSLSNAIATNLARLLMLVASETAQAGQMRLDCPPDHDGKPLKSVELFEGDPANKIESIPEDGRFVVPEPLPTDPNYTLGCTYRGSKDMVTVVLPRHIRVCEFPHYPHVHCH